MGTKVTLEMIYEEVKKVNERLSLIEETVEEVIIKALPEVTLGKKKTKEIESSVQEMKRGNCVTLEELKSA
jgi:hypothetical protein